MSKKFDNCVLCNSKKFLNYTNMCRECNRTKEGVKIKEEVLTKKFKANKAAAKQAEENKQE